MNSATYQSYTSPAGTTSQYHVYANNLDYSKPVGVVFYFDGDYWRRNGQGLHPDEGMLVAMGKIANARNWSSCRLSPRTPTHPAWHHLVGRRRHQR